MVSEMIAKAENYLVNVQNEDGSWGGDKNIKGSIEETALAIAALQKEDFEPNRRRGLKRLEMFNEEYGLKAAPIGLYFASLWYDEKMYPLTAYLEAVVRETKE